MLTNILYYTQENGLLEITWPGAINWKLFMLGRKLDQFNLSQFNVN